MIAKMLLNLLSKPKAEKIVCCSLFKYWNENVISTLFKLYGWPKISCDSTIITTYLFFYGLHFELNFLVARFKREFGFRPFWKRKSGSLRIAVQFPNPWRSSPIFRYLSSSGVNSRIFLPLEESGVFEAWFWLWNLVGVMKMLSSSGVDAFVIFRRGRGLVWKSWSYM